MESKKEVLEKSVMEVDSGESSTEEAEPESPRSVVMEMKKKVERVHSQILRIREEESHLGEDFVGGDKKNKNDVVCGGGGEDFHEKRRRLVNVVVVSRPVLPCSPLSGKNNVRRPWTEATPSINQSIKGVLREG
ncbi:uncharacterized protein LOC110426631 isoform X2 [Herrania umbratica]|uniref:Uncharacterized protein LOC110426631 isoform X2 n=1 Tax=Herrania umbratica TaxID=108875 RepID=A0A6J1BEK8_9ROSI|nr:uncharacterized protein LOC110426631 isoform X2 [Herrania umbratica]